MKPLIVTVLALAAFAVPPGLLDAADSGGDSPTPRIADIAALADLAHEARAPLAIDSPLPVPCSSGP